MKLQLTYNPTVNEIPLHELRTRLNELQKDKFTGIFCSSEERSAIEFAYLKSKAYADIKTVEGGYDEFIQAILPGKVFKHLNS